jgi:hypothetical protein
MTQMPEIGDTMPIVTTKPVEKTTTYSPASPLTVIGALAVVVGLVAVMRRK